MSKIGVFMANGCEEIEGLTVVDILRRGGVEVLTISITDCAQVTSSHFVTFKTDTVKSAVSFEKLDGVVLPGGMPGTLNLGADETVNRIIREYASSGKLVAAICAAPSVLGAAGILEGKHAVCHPGFEPKLTGAIVSEDSVMRDGNIITSRGMGTAIAFGLEILDYLKGPEAVQQVRKGLVY